MKRVVVLGSGIAGVASAYYLAREGCKVTVVDRQAEPAAETSHANAGLVTPSFAHSWANPGAPLMLLKSMAQRHPAFKLRFNPDPRFIGWGLRFLGQCTSARARANTAATFRISAYSQAQLDVLRAETGIDDKRNARGILYIYRTPRQLAAGVAAMREIEALGARIEVCDAARARAIEPALAGLGDDVAGGVFCPTDESADCRVFTTGLAAAASSLGVEFLHGVTVTALEREGERLAGVRTSDGPIAADDVVLALGSYSPILAATAGRRIPVTPVKGYSLTLPITDPARAPTVGFVDESIFMAFSTLGENLRVTATAEFTGYDTGWKERDFVPILAAARRLFAAAADFSKPTYWACLRPLTPDGPPLLGRGRLANLWYNTGHGSLGWTMGCGSGRIIADLVLGRNPEIAMQGLEAGRYRAA